MNIKHDNLKKEKKTPLISVIVPMYNSERDILKCLTSISDNTYLNIEVIIVDDGSTDNSVDICRKYIEKFPNFHLVTQENQGVSAARNTGIENAKGDYVAFCDSDDWLNSNYFFQMVESLEYCDMPVCRIVKTSSEDLCNAFVCSDCIFDDVTSPTRNIISCCRGLYLKSVLDKYRIRFTKGIKSGEDQEFVYKYMLYCQKFSFVPEAIYYYRSNPNSVMHKKTYIHFDAIEALKDAVEYAVENGTSEQVEQYRIDLINYNALRTIEFAITTLLTSKEHQVK